MSIVTVNRVAKMIGALLLALVLIPAVPAWSAEHPALIRARTLYNAGSLDEAISAAGLSRLDAESVDASGLVIARAHLERYRLRADPADLASARENLAVVRTASLSPRDQLDLLVGLGQSLYFVNSSAPRRSYSTRRCGVLRHSASEIGGCSWIGGPRRSIDKRGFSLSIAAKNSSGVFSAGWPRSCGMIPGARRPTTGSRRRPEGRATPIARGTRPWLAGCART